MGYRSIISLMPKTPPVDADAQAFLTAAAITDPTISAAINTLVVQMKADNIWSKMKAVYPMVGGTANSHKFNLKDPRDLDAAFRIVFNGGWTHGSNGAKPNGTNAFADTKFNQSGNLTPSNNHVSIYSRTNLNSTEIPFSLNVDIGITNNVSYSFSQIITRVDGNVLYENGSQVLRTAVANSLGFSVGSSISSTSGKVYKNGTLLATNTTAQARTMFNNNIYIGASNNITAGTPAYYSPRENAFASIGDGLTDTEAANLYTAVQTFQTTLGRSVGTQTVSDSDAQAFVTNAAIVDQVEATAVNNLVVGMKADGIWSKMKAIYPFVGGSASAHKFNLKDPRDLDAAFRLVFNGGWTHNSNGATPNGVNGFADTRLKPFSVLSQNSAHASFYLRNSLNTGFQGYGVVKADYTERMDVLTFQNVLYSAIGVGGASQASTSATPYQSLILASRVNSTSNKLYTIGVLRDTKTATNTSNLPNANYYLGAVNQSEGLYTSQQNAFASIGDGLTDTEAANLYTAVQTFQTTLGRSVGTQTVSDSDAQAFVTNAAIVDQVQATAVNNLVVGMKADGIWSKMKAIYPFVGGSASAHKFNLKDPRDLDAAFRIVFNGGWTHSNNGSTPNGVNGFADTFLTPSINLSINSAHFSKYNRNNDLVGNKIDGAITGSVFLQQNYSAGNAIIGEVAAINSYTQTDTRGLFTATRTASNSSKVFKNSTQQGTTNTSTISSLPIFSIHLGRRNDGGSGSFFNSYECAFASIGDGITDTEAANLYTRVQAFQTALSRQV